MFCLVLMWSKEDDVDEDLSNSFSCEETFFRKTRVRD